MNYQGNIDQINLLLADNESEDIDEGDIRTCLISILDFAKAQAWTRIVATLAANASYVSVSLIGLQKSQLLIINEGTVISASEAWQSFVGGYDPVTGTVNFLGPLSGNLEILIRPIEQ